MRKYDERLVLEIKRNQRIEKINGIDVLIKPIPDDFRMYVLDPRVLEIAIQKKKMFSSRSAVGFKLSNERYRPDKVTVDLTTVTITESEELIGINDTHMINMFFYQREDRTEKSPVMIYLHGGGFTAGDNRLYKNQMRLIAEKSGALIIFPEYRLSPECPFPGPIEDAFQSVKWVYENAERLKVDTSKFMVAGDSAGGSLTNACLLQDKDGIIKKAFELYPGVDMSDFRTQTKYEWSYEKYPIIDDQKEFAYSRIDRIKNSIGSSGKDSLYLQGKAEFNNPLVSIVYASDEQLKKFPPVVLVASEYDYLKVGSDYFVKRMKDLGLEVMSVLYRGCDHGFFDLLGTVVQAEEVCNFIAEEILSI